jgi:hypothetical protein
MSHCPDNSASNMRVAFQILSRMRSQNKPYVRTSTRLTDMHAPIRTRRNRETLTIVLDAVPVRLARDLESPAGACGCGKAIHGRGNSPRDTCIQHIFQVGRYARPLIFRPSPVSTQSPIPGYTPRIKHATNSRIYGEAFAIFVPPCLLAGMHTCPCV